MARPKALINWKRVNGFLMAGCSGAEIAGLIGIHPNTLYLAVQEKYKCGFSEHSSLKKEAGQGLLRYRQYQSALNGNVTMMIFLGKQILGQKDKVENTNPEGKNIHITVDSPETALVLQRLLEPEEG